MFFSVLARTSGFTEGQRRALFHPNIPALMNRTEHLLWLVSEECNEVGQRASKAARFALAEVQPGQPLSNADRILQEWYDLKAVMEMMVDEGLLTPWANEREVIAAKKAKVEKFLGYSAECGTLETAPKPAGPDARTSTTN